jgi:hypothetical protein
MFPMIEASQCTVGTVPIPDGLSIGGQSRRYSMCNRHTRTTPVQGMGVRIQDRVKLDNVLEAKARGGCLRNCLRDSGRWARGTFWTSGTWLRHKSMKFEQRGLCRY